MDSEAKTSENTGKTILHLLQLWWQMGNCRRRHQGFIAAGVWRDRAQFCETFEKSISIILKFQLAIWLFA